MNQDQYQRCSQPHSDAWAHIFFVATHFVVVYYWQIGSYVYLLAKTFIRPFINKCCLKSAQRD